MWRSNRHSKLHKEYRVWMAKKTKKGWLEKRQNSKLRGHRACEGNDIISQLLFWWWLRTNHRFSHKVSYFDCRTVSFTIIYAFLRLLNDPEIGLGSFSWIWLGKKLLGVSSHLVIKIKKMHKQQIQWKCGDSIGVLSITTHSKDDGSRP